MVFLNCPFSRNNNNNKTLTVTMRENIKQCVDSRNVREQLLHSFDDTRSHIPFFQTCFKGFEYHKGAPTGKGTAKRTRLSDLAGVQLRGTSRRTDRSCSPFVMSRCNGLPIPEKECGGKPRERLTETRTLRDRACSIILKPLS